MEPAFHIIIRLPYIFSIIELVHDPDTDQNDHH